MFGVALLNATSATYKITGSQTACGHNVEEYTTMLSVWGSGGASMNEVHHIKVIGGIIKSGEGTLSNNDTEIVSTGTGYRAFTFEVEWISDGENTIEASCDYQLVVGLGIINSNISATKLVWRGRLPVPSILPTQDIFVGGNTTIKLAASVPYASSYTYTVSKGTLGGTTETSTTTTATSIAYKGTAVGYENVYVKANISTCSLSSSNLASNSFYIHRLATVADLVINGPSSANPNQICNFSATVNAGPSPYTYTWWFSYDNNKYTPFPPAQGNGQSISKQMPTTTHLWMKVQSRDALGNILSITKLVRNNTVGVPTKSAEIGEFDITESDLSGDNEALMPDKKKFIAEGESIVSIYPNPSSGVFKISAQNSNTRAVVYNTVGAIVWSGKLSDFESTIDISVQPVGVYILKVNQGEKGMTKKIFKY
jgi:hypothetical protein